MSLPFYPHDIHWDDELKYQAVVVERMKKEVLNTPKCKECNKPLKEKGQKRKYYICTDPHCKRYNERQQI